MLCPSGQTWLCCAAFGFTKPTVHCLLYKLREKCCLLTNKDRYFVTSKWDVKILNVPGPRVEG